MGKENIEPLSISLSYSVMTCVYRLSQQAQLLAENLPPISGSHPVHYWMQYCLIIWTPQVQLEEHPSGCLLCTMMHHVVPEDQTHFWHSFPCKKAMPMHINVCVCVICLHEWTKIFFFFIIKGAFWVPLNRVRCVWMKDKLLQDAQRVTLGCDQQ